MSNPSSLDDAIPENLQSALSAAREAPSEESSWDTLDEIAGDLDRPDEVAALYREVLLSPPEQKKLSLELWDELGRRGVDFHEEWFGEPTLAIGLLQHLVTNCEGDWAFERLTLMLTMAERWEDLLSEYDRALQRVSDEESRLRLLDEAARIAKDFAGQGSRASDYLKALLISTPDNDTLAASLERRLEQQERHQDLVEIWRVRLPVLEADSALSTRGQIADRLLNALNDAPAALIVIEEILGAGGESAACRLLEELSAQETANGEARRRSLSLLREHYAASERADDELRVLEASLELAQNDEQRLQLHADCTDVLLRNDYTEAALEHASARLALDPQSQAAHTQVRELADKAARPERYATALSEAAQASASHERRIELLVEAAQVSETRVKDTDSAIQRYLAILNDSNATDAPRRLVARSVRPLLLQEVNRTDANDESERQSRQHRLLKVLEDLSTLEPGAAEQREVLAEAAKLADTLQDTDRSLALWQRCLDASEGDTSALDARINLLERVERWEVLIQDLRKRAESSTRAAHQREDLVRVARLYETRLFRVEEAIEVWQEIEILFGTNAQTVDALVDLCSAAGRYQDVIKLLTAAVESEAEPQRRTDQLARLGDVYREQEGAPLLAVERYSQALDSDSLHEASRSGLRALLQNPACAREAVETLAKSLLVADDWPGVLELVEQRIAVSEEQEKTYALLCEAALLMEQRAQDPSGALAYLCRAFELDSNDTLEAEVLRLARSSGQWKTAVSGYHRAIDRCADPARGRKLRLVRGEILETRLNEKRSALASYRQILETDATHLEATQSVARVATQLMSFEDLSWVVVHHAEAVDGVDPLVAGAVAEVTQAEGYWEKTTTALFERISAATSLAPRVSHDLRRQLALWYRDHRRDPITAQALLTQAVEAVRENSTLELLAELQRDTPSRALVETLIMLADGTEQNLDVLHEASRVSLEHVNDTALAQPIVERTLSVASKLMVASADPVGKSCSDIATWCNERLVEIAQSKSDFATALQLLETAAQLPFPSEQQVALSFRAAMVAMHNLSRPDRAISLCEGILVQQPTHAEAIALLSSIFESEERHADLLALRRSELSLNPDLERRLFLRLEEARILPQLGPGDDERIAALRSNVDESPGHRESIEQIVSILGASGQNAPLYELLCEQAQLVADRDQPNEASELWAQAGTLCESALEDVERAAVAYKASVSLSPTVEVLDSLARLAIAGNEHPAAINWLEQRLNLTPLDELLARRTTIFQLAVELRTCNRLDEARIHLQDGLEKDPAGSEMRELLSSLYREAEDWELLAPTLTAGVDYTEDSKQKVAYLRTAARVQRRQLGKLDQAIPLLQRAVELEPKDRPLRLSLADGLRHAERHDEARSLLENLLEEFGRRRTPERARVHFHLAQIARATGNLDVALRELDLASKVDRNNMEMLELLGEVAREKGQLEEAERAYRTLLLLLGRTRPEETEVREGIGESSVLFELHRIAHERGQTQRARDLLDSALEAASSDAGEARRLEQALREAGQHELLLQALDQRLRRTEPGVARAEVLRSRANVLLELEQPDSALDARMDALREAPQNSELLEEVWKHAGTLNRLDPIGNALETLAEATQETQPAVACELCLRIGKLYESSGDTKKAAHLYTIAQGTGHEPTACLDSLERVGVGEDLEALSAALAQFVKFASAEPSNQRFTTVLLRLGTLELGFGRTELAAEHLQLALSRGCDEQACLELLLETTVNKPTEAATVQLLEGVARRRNNSQALLIALTEGAKLGCASPSALKEGAALAQEQGDELSRITILEGAVSLAEAQGDWDPAAWAVTDLATVREEDSDPKAAASLLQRCIPQMGLEQAFELRLRLANLATKALDDLTLAASVYEELLAETPTAIRVWRPLFDVYRKLGDTEKLEAQISRLEADVEDPEVKNSLKLERIRILIDSDRNDDAETELSEFIKNNPESEEAPTLLENLLEKQGRTEELHELVAGRLATAREEKRTESVTECTLRLGNLLVGSNKEAALAVYRESLELFSEDQVLLEAYLRLLDTEELTAERIRSLTQLTRLQSGEKAEVSALELVQLHQAQHDSMGVEEALNLGLTQVPGSQKLHERSVAWFRDLEDWENLGGALSRQASAQQNPAESRKTRKMAAEVYAVELKDPRRAAEALEPAIHPTSPNAEFLTSIAQYWIEADEPEQALAHLSRAVETQEEGAAELVALLQMRGNLQRELGPDSLERLSAAVDDLQRVAELDSTWDQRILAEVLENQLSLMRARGTDEQTQGPTILHLSRVLQHLGDMDPAASLLQDWLSQHPTDKAGQQQLGALSTQRADWQTSADAYQGLVVLCEGEEQVQAVLLLAEACEKSGDPLAAREALENVHASNSTNDQLRSRLRQMYESAGEHHGWASLLLSEAASAEDAANRYELLCSAGDLFMRADDSKQEAFDAYERALEVKSDPDTLVKAVDAQVQLGDVEEAARRLDEAIRSHGKRRSPQLSALQHAMARVANAAGDDEAIFAWLEAALYSDRQNGTVASELATLAMSRGEFDVAVKALQLVTLLKSPGPMSRAEAYLRQAVIARHRGDAKKSALLAKRAVTTDPSYEDAKSFLDELQASAE